MRCWHSGSQTVPIQIPGPGNPHLGNRSHANRPFRREEFHLATAAESRVELGRIVGTTVSAFFDISLGLLATPTRRRNRLSISIHVCVPDTRTLTTAKATLVEDITCTVACTSSDDTFTVVAPHLSRQVHTATCGIGDGN